MVSFISHCHFNHRFGEIGTDQRLAPVFICCFAPAEEFLLFTSKPGQRVWKFGGIEGHMLVASKRRLPLSLSEIPK